MMGPIPGDPSTHSCDLSTVILYVEKLYENLSDLPLSVRDLLQVCSFFSRLHILQRLYEMRHADKTNVDLEVYSVEELLIYTLAFNRMSIPSPLSQTCFKIALQHFWEVQSGIFGRDQYSVSLLLLYAQIFLFYFTRPFRALGMLQVIGPIISKLGHRVRMDDGSVEPMSRGHH